LTIILSSRLQFSLFSIILSSRLPSFDHSIVFPSSDYSSDHYIVFPSSLFWPLYCLPVFPLLTIILSSRLHSFGFFKLFLDCIIKSSSYDRNHGYIIRKKQLDDDGVSRFIYLLSIMW
jgi:hypothetical protein